MPAGGCAARLRRWAAAPPGAWTWVLPLAAALGAMPSAARAAGNLLLLDPPPASTTAAIGLSAWSLPARAGAAPGAPRLIPALDLAWANGAFISTDSGLGVNLSQRADVQAGVRLWPRQGGAADRRGPGLPGRLQAEAFANWQVAEVLLLQSGWLAGSARRHDGRQVELGATTGLPLPGGDLLGIGWSTTWANAVQRRDELGAVDRPPLPGGWRPLDTALTLSSEHRVNEHWRLDAQWVLTRQAGATAQLAPGVQRHSGLGQLSLWRTW